MLLKGDQGRAPSAPPSFPPKSIGGGSPLQLRAWEGLGRGKGDSRAREREAREFLSRRRLRATGELEIFAKTHRRETGENLEEN